MMQARLNLCHNEHMHNPLCRRMHAYLQFNISTYVLACVRVIEQVQYGGDQGLVDAAQLTVDDVFQDGAQASPLCHNLGVLQCWITRKHNRIKQIFTI